MTAIVCDQYESDISVEIESMRQNAQIKSLPKEVYGIGVLSFAAKGSNAVFVSEESFASDISNVFRDEDSSDLDVLLEGDKSIVLHLHSLIVMRHSPLLRDLISQLHEQPRCDQRENVVKAYASQSSEGDSSPFIWASWEPLPESSPKKNSSDRRMKLVISDARLSPKDLKSIFKYMYTEKFRCPQYDPLRILAVYEAVSKLQVKGLEKPLLAFMVSALNPRDAYMLLLKGGEEIDQYTLDTCIQLLCSFSPKIFEKDHRELLMKLPMRTIQRLIRLGTFQYEEMIFEIAVEHTRRTCSKFNMTEQDFYRRYYEPYIAYMNLPIEYTFSEVLPLRIATHSQLQAAFKYTVLTRSNQEVWKLSHLQRTDRQSSPLSYKFANPPDSAFTISNSSHTAVHKDNMKYNTLFVEPVWRRSGTYYVEFECKPSLYTNNLHIGICEARHSRSDGFPGQLSEGLQLQLSSGNLIRLGMPASYTNSTSGKFRVGVMLVAESMGANSIYFFVNGENRGKMACPLILPLKACVSLYQTGDSATILRSPIPKL